MKTSAKYLGVAVGAWAMQHEPKWPKNYLTYDVTENLQPPTKKSFFRVQTRRMVDSFEPLNSCLVQSAEELWCW